MTLLRSGLRRLFSLNVLAALSLLMTIALGCLWARSLSVRDHLGYFRSYQEVSIGTAPWRLWFTLNTTWGPTRVRRDGWDYQTAQWEPDARFMNLIAGTPDPWHGFILYTDESQYPTHGWRTIQVFIPLWFPMALTLVLPLCWLRLRRRREHARRVRLGLCLQCGYDTRATPDPNGPRLPQCPECGRPSQAAGDPSSVNGDQRT